MPLRPEPYWTDERLEEFRARHMKELISFGASKDDIRAIELKWIIEDSEKSEYRRFLLALQDGEHKKHPRYKQWVAYCEAAWSDAKEPVPPPFLAWLERLDIVKHVAITPIGLITYEFKSDGKTAEQKDRRIIELITAHPNLDLKSYEDYLGITIVRIDRPKSEPDDSIPIGEPY
jgi:hypothetical protein